MRLSEGAKVQAISLVHLKCKIDWRRKNMADLRRKQASRQTLTNLWLEGMQAPTERAPRPSHQH